MDTSTSSFIRMGQRLGCSLTTCNFCIPNILWKSIKSQHPVCMKQLMCMCGWKERHMCNKCTRDMLQICVWVSTPVLELPGIRNKRLNSGWEQWLTPLILAEVETGNLWEFLGQPGRHSETLYQKRKCIFYPHQASCCCPIIMFLELERNWNTE